MIEPEAMQHLANKEPLNHINYTGNVPKSKGLTVNEK